MCIINLKKLVKIMKKIKNRNSNFELMRIISMLFIILGHIIGHGNMLNNCANNTIRFILEILEYIFIVHVNSFVLLSGYFQSKSKFKLSKFLALILQVIFYSSLILIIFVKLEFIKEYNIVTFINNMLPSSINGYWFIKAYIVVYLLSDMINKFTNSLDKKEYQNVLLILFLLFSVSTFLTGGKFFENNGFNFYTFIFLYMIGGYLRRYPIKETYHFKRLSPNGYKLFLLFMFFFMAFINYSLKQISLNINHFNPVFNEFSNRVLNTSFTYASPFVIIQAIFYFLYFETLNIKSKFINFISSCTFGIYLFHDNNYVRSIIYKALMIDYGTFQNYNMLGRLFIVAIIIFIIGVIIESLRKLLIWILFKIPLTNKIVDKIKNFINSFNFKVNW